MSTITNETIRQWSQLRKAAERRSAGLFIMEGTKAVTDAAPLFSTEAVLATHEWLETHAAEGLTLGAIPVTARQMERLSSMTTPQGVAAICRIPRREPDYAAIAQTLTLALDSIQDPGNLGTIIRTAHWMGVTDILASHGTADCYSPKVVQATMGSLARVRVHYCDLPQALKQMQDRDATVYVTALHGEDLYTLTPPGAGGSGSVVVIGNEGRGVSPEVMQCATRRITIPTYPRGSERCESLNAAVATAIILSHLRFGCPAAVRHT